MEQQKYPILSVKFKMPEPRKNYVVRQSIFDQLQHMKEYKITIVKAGAGSGKTTLLSSYSQTYQMPNFKWLTLDEHMNQSFIFWNYVVEQMGCYIGEDREGFQKFFDGNIQKENLWQMLSVFMNKLDNNTEVFMVLDDFHVIKDEFLISTINYFVENMPSNIHMVLLSRDIPNIYLGTLTMENNLLLIEEDKIRLTYDESMEFLLHTLNLKQSEEEIKYMIDTCDGWIGGLQLMAVATQGQGGIRKAKTTFSNRMIDDYITKEIFEYLSKDEQEFLIKTSILSYFNQEICDQYIPEFNFTTIMKSIISKNLFVINIDNEGQVYRYHAILADYLTGLFEAKEIDKDQLLNLAASIYEQRGEYEECLHHLFKCKNYEKIMDLLLTMPQTTLNFTYMMKVPLEEISKNTDFAYQYFFCHYASIDMESCEKIYDFIVNSMKDEKTFVAFKDSDLFFNINWNFKNINIMPLDQVDKMPLNTVTKAYLLIKDAYFLFACGKNVEAMKYLEKAEKIFKLTGNDYIGAFILAEKTQILEDNGELNEALRLYEHMWGFVQKVPTIAPSYHIGIAGVYIRQLQLAKAWDSLESARKLINDKALNMYSAYLYTLAEYSYILGDSEKTEEILTRVTAQDNFDNIMYYARLLRYPICRGQHKELAEIFANSYQTSGEIPKVLDTDILYAAIQYEEGNVTEAMALAEKIIARARKNQKKLKIVEGDLLKVRFMYEQNMSKREIINLLVEAVSYAYEDSIAVPFWFEKNSIKFLIDAYSGDIQSKLSTEEWEFLNEVVTLQDMEERNRIVQTKFGLSEREQEVLSELAKGCTNKQIAENLCISLATVKSHIINIYGKLGVNNRVAAINKYY